ncbi:SufE family protein [Chitinophaga nivalis]|uniref:SufE family protein n=1 Tax=Chitinophaga nivalis TaxID=2991709 RepID=A0ABT3IIG5_9BACT|nr:SufE family protein [Chitinophaga nivalis]MCW3466558.1 SufE family protein [Chitinophaga nivalis]MCW3483751.1 SufE family protein [Chitinophaga nivalis]
MTIKAIQEEIVADFAMMGSWEDKYEYIIQLGKELPLIDEAHKVPENLIKGCQSRVWLHTSLEDGKLVFTGDSDAVITKGLISLMIYVLSGHTPQDIAAADIFFIDAIGLSSHLSPTRSNGLLSMLKQMKLYAIAYQAKINQQ